jgi:hypothetical protein
VGIYDVGIYDVGIYDVGIYDVGIKFRRGNTLAWFQQSVDGVPCDDKNPTTCEL